MTAPVLHAEENRWRDDICRVGRSLFERGFVHATAGNISVRLDDGYLITPTDACLGFLDPARLSRLDLQGQQLSGDRASKTLALHRRIYEAAHPFDAHTRCVLHTHSTHCVALTLRAAPACETPLGPELLPPITPYFVMKVGHVPVLDYARPGSPPAADAAAAAITRYGQAGAPLRAVMMARLGPNVWHESPAQAMATLEELEETARLWLLTSAPDMTPPTALQADQIEDLRQSFGARW
jgi:ribulose-5-phosphate 4-epimerase/fuculose-1-phosphate aldolase